SRVQTLRRRLSELKAPRGEIVPHGDLLMLATLVDETPSDASWLFEIKYDGVRVLASRAGDAIELRGRSGQVVTTRYPEVAAARRRLLRRPRAGARRGLSRRRLRAGSGRRGREEARQPVFRGALARLAEDQVSAAPGVRDRRLHGAPGHAGAFRRPAPGPVRPGRAGLRLQGRHRIRRAGAQDDQREAPSAGASDLAVRARHAGRTRAPLGGAATGR